MRKLNKIILAILFLLFAGLACVLPNSETVPTIKPTLENTVVAQPTLLPTDDAFLDCETMNSSGIFGIVSASPKGGLNIRDLPLESGGIILTTISDGTKVEIFSSVGNNWNMVRFKDKNGKIMCGFAKMDYVQVQ